MKMTLGPLILILLLSGILNGCSNAVPSVDYLYRIPSSVDHPGSSEVSIGNPVANPQARTAGGTHKATIMVQPGVVQTSTSTDNQYKLEIY